MIGLTGKARAGKDTAGRFIEQWATGNTLTCERHSFAAKLKVSAARSLGFEGDEAACIAFCEELKHDGYVSYSIKVGDLAFGGKTYGYNMPGREFLQRYGTEAHRDVFDSDFWIEALLEPLWARDRELRAPDAVVVTDARFKNEAEAIRAGGGEVWEIVRPEHDDELKGALDAHVSEAGLPEELVDRVIVNDSDLAHLDRELRIALVESFA